MTSHLQTARDYLSPPPFSFWRWTDDGEVLVWSDGMTIAFRQELIRVARRLAPQGLPPFGALALLLAATRANWPEATSARGALDNWRLQWCAWLDLDLLFTVLDRLQEVYRLDPALRTDVEAKAVLAEVVFEASRYRVDPEQSSKVLECLLSGFGEPLEQSPEDPDICGGYACRLTRELRCLAEGLTCLDADALRLRLKTGLDALPESADVMLPNSGVVRRLIAELEHDVQLCGLARLARRLMAAATLPCSILDRDELPVGGVSDISNRGPLDRLLHSELAYDDLTLAVRIAANEALYTRRESPPRQPIRQRAVLLESGIRSWGVPRVFAAAVALAIAATADRRTAVTAFRASGDRVEPVDLTTREGLISHLQVLETDLHPGAALAAFQEKLREAKSSTAPLLVTTDDVFDDPEFQRCLLLRELTPLHVATVNRDGRFQLLERNLRGGKTLREASLSLEGLFSGRKPVVRSIRDREQPSDLPDILSVRPFPLRLPHELQTSRILRVEGYGLLALTKDRRLMLWNEPECGALQLADDVPVGRLWWWTFDDVRGLVTAVVGGAARGALHLLRFDLDDDDCVSQRLAIGRSARGVRGVFAHNGALFVVLDEIVRIVSEETGEILQTLSKPRWMRWRRGRFFQSRPSEWRALSHDGRGAHFEPVEAASHSLSILTFFEREGVDGPIGVTMQGDLFLSAVKELRRVNHGLTGRLDVAAVSYDGRRVVLAERHSRLRAVVDVDTRKVAKMQGDPLMLAETHGCRQPFVRSLRRRLRHIFVGKQGLLTLTTRKGPDLCISYDEGLDRILLGPASPHCGDAARRIAFEPIKAPRDVGYRLAAATWPDGSRAFLDSRGLLHLKSSDRAVPESSMALIDGALSGWCSDGRRWGSAYFTGLPNEEASLAAFESAIREFARRLP